jgi:hypothetical protein
MLLNERYKWWEDKVEELKQLLDDFKEMGFYWKLNEEALD